MGEVKSTRFYLYIGITLAGVFGVSLFYPFALVHAPINYFTLIPFFLITLYLQSYPVKIKNHYLSFTLITQMFLFVQYGFLIEVVTALLAQLLSILVQKRRVTKKHLLFLCTTFWCSFFSSTAYHLTLASSNAATITTQEGFPFLAIVAYAFVGFWVSYGFVNWGQWVRERPLFPFQFQSFKWRALTTLICFMLSLLIMIVYRSEVSILGAILVTIPALIMAYIVRLLVDLDEGNEQMKRIHELTTAFASELNLDKSLDALINTIQKIEDYDVCFIYRADWQQGCLVLVRFDSRQPFSEQQLFELTIPLYAGRKGEVGESRGQEHSFFNLQQFEFYWGNDVPQEFKQFTRMISVPIQTKDKILGVLALGSFAGKSYLPNEVTLFEIIANHAATTMESAYVYQQTERRALTDELTGLYNYRGFEQCLEEKLEEAVAKQQSVTLLIIDIDHFKQINDRFGHLMGNRVLQAITRIMQHSIRPQDILCRYGGEEFTIILPQTDQETAWRIAEHVRQEIAAKPIDLQNDLGEQQQVTVHVTASIGIAMYPEHAEDALSLVRHADRAMYVGAKQNGRNKVALYGN